MGILCGSEYAEENAQVFVGGESSMCGQAKIGMYVMREEKTFQS